MRKQTFEIFTDPEKFCAFVNGLTMQGRKFHVTPWQDNAGKPGFVVWHY